MVGSEALPYAKSGGLGEVLGALPGALGRIGCDVDLVMPAYRGIEEGAPAGSVTVPVGSALRSVNLRVHGRPTMPHRVRGVATILRPVRALR